MYIHLTSEGLVSKNAPCSFRTVLSQELNFGDTEYEVALVSWHYYGQKFLTHLPFEDDRSIELQKCSVKEVELVWQWDSGNAQELFVEINNTKVALREADYTWNNFRLAVVNSFASLFYRLKLGTRIELKNSGIQFYYLSGNTNIKFSAKLVEILGLNSHMSTTGLTVPADVDAGNFHIKTFNKVKKYGRTINDIIIFPEGCIIKSTETFSITLVAGEWSIANFERLIQRIFGVESFNITYRSIYSSRTHDGYKYFVIAIASHNPMLSVGKQLFFNDKLQQVFNIRHDSPQNQRELSRELRNRQDPENINFLKYSEIGIEFVWQVEKRPVRKIILNQSMFSNAASMCDALTKSLSKNTDGEKIFNFYIDKSSKVACIEHAETKNGIRWMLRPSQSIINKLGFTNYIDTSLPWFAHSSNYVKQPNFSLSAFTYTAKGVPSEESSIMNGGLPNFWIYCDVIQDQCVGEKQQPLLRIIANNAPEETFWIESCDPYYFPVNKCRINAISIDVWSGSRVSTGTLVHLENPILAVLHFRPRS
jgi:hypothetical protein